ncbi:response regulator transcription factor [Aurantiacibacter zhengii]|uniref:response regulator transcription factor n=1 Tax=Aurantiacibacter zhengii TaxID=2307003 RepID=UPI0013147783|nr:response regulator [Aurantiacibacter zhengii]
MKYPIYISDADKDSRIELKRMLSQGGWSCRPFLSAADLVNEIRALEPGVVLLDVRNTSTDGADLIETISEANFALPIIAIAEKASADIVVAAMKSGAVDFLEKPFPAETLEKAIEGAAPIVDQRIRIVDQTEKDKARIEILTPRELEVLKALSRGDSNAMISQNFDISVRTVETHRANIIRKIDLPNIVGAISVFQRYEAASSARPV